MKNKTILLGLFASIFLLASYTVKKKTAGSHPGSTGAPLEGTCASGGCHDDGAVVYNNNSVNSILFSSMDSTYTPGQVYTVTLTVTKPATSKFGFELTVLKDSDSTDVGSLSTNSGFYTQLLNYTIGANTRNSITHNTAGTQTTSANTDSWIFSWTAPLTNEGNITLHYATNCTNNDGLVQGDQIYVNKFTIKPKINTSLFEVKNADDNFNAFYNKAEKELTVNYVLKRNKQVKISLYDIKGRLIQNLTDSYNTKGERNDSFKISENLKPGVYLVNLNIDKDRITKKIIIE